MGPARYSKRTTTSVVSSEYFVLIDASAGFRESNRRYLGKVDITPVEDDELAEYRESYKYPEPLFPYSLYSSAHTYHETKELFQPQKSQYFNSSDELLRIQKHVYTTVNPFDLLSFLSWKEERAMDERMRKLQDEYNIIVLQTLAGNRGGRADARPMGDVIRLANLLDDEDPANAEDRGSSPSPSSADSMADDDRSADSDFGFYTDLSVLKPKTERRLLEADDPFVYGQYSDHTCNGCPHYARDAFIVCPVCKTAACDGAEGLCAAPPDSFVFGCNLCHDHEVDGHDLDPKTVIEMYCLHCSAIGPIGSQCQACRRTVGCPQNYCPHCKQLSNLTQAYEVFQHCPACDKCVESLDFDNHICIDSSECCPICTFSLNINTTDLTRLPCNPRHIMHTRCFDNMVSTGTIFCPLDHKVVISTEAYAKIRASNLYLSMSSYTYILDHAVINCYYCHDCELVSFDFSCGVAFADDFCHYCFGVNCKSIASLGVRPGDIVPLLAEDARQWGGGGEAAHEQGSGLWMGKECIDRISDLVARRLHRPASSCSVDRGHCVDDDLEAALGFRPMTLAVFNALRQTDKTAAAKAHLAAYRALYAAFVPKLKYIGSSG